MAILRNAFLPCSAAVLLLYGSAGVAEALDSTWTGESRKASANYDRFWQQPRNALRLDHGWLQARNNASHLYLLIDLTGDTVQDRPVDKSPWGDYLMLAFDIDLNHRITPDRDIALTLYPGSHRLGRQLFKGPGRFSGLHASQSRLATRFDSSPTQAQPHRLWEVVIPLDELSIKAGGKVRLGLTTHSQRPAFNDELPGDYSRNFKQLIELQLAAAPLRQVHRVKPDIKTLRRQLAGNRLQVRPDFDKLRRPGIPGNGLPSGCQPPTGEPVKRSIEADGSITLLYASGAKKQHVGGGWKMFCPDGTPIPVYTTKSTQISPTMPPTLPDPLTLQWLEFHQFGLLGIIQNLVGDEQMVESYLATENAGWTPYETIDNRRRTIDYLLAE
jgi:hypothetical protein